MADVSVAVEEAQARNLAVVRRRVDLRKVGASVWPESKLETTIVYLLAQARQHTRGSVIARPRFYARPHPLHHAAQAHQPHPHCRRRLRALLGDLGRAVTE